MRSSWRWLVLCCWRDAEQFIDFGGGEVAVHFTRSNNQVRGEFYLIQEVGVLEVDIKLVFHPALLLI